MKYMMERPECILVIGSADGELILQLRDDLRLGEKHIISRSEFLGGSGVNHTLRLINGGFPVFPILSVGDDQLGNRIKKEILASARRAKVSKQILSFIRSDEFFVPNIKTPLSTIIAQKAQRTAFTDRVDGTRYFKDHLKCRLAYLDQLGVSIKAVIIGHIYADRPAPNHSCPGGECTRSIIQLFRDRCFVFANFGNTQIDIGVDFWENDLKSLNVFQLNLGEARHFFSQKKVKMSLIEIIKWLKKRQVTAIITLHRFGAIGTYRNSGKVILAWPFKIDKIIDTIGAGDAFGAGVVSHLYPKTDFSFDDFLAAMEMGRAWATYACTTLSGARNCPDRLSLQRFYENVIAPQFSPIESLDMEDAERILWVLDQAS